MDYATYVTSEHRHRPKFIAAIEAITSPLDAVTSAERALPAAFDLDLAVGVQLDAVGLWVGRDRYLAQSISGVYFTLGPSGPGFGQGVWKGPFDPSTGLVALPDDIYRILLRATIAANQWDGSIPGAYAVWETLFGPDQLLIQDNGDMSMLFALRRRPDTVTLALLTGGYIALKPAGVRIAGYLVPSVANAPFFGFGVQNAAIAGFGTGAFAHFL